MEKRTGIKKKVSILVILILATVFTFTTVIESYGTWKDKTVPMYDVAASLESAYNALIKADNLEGVSIQAPGRKTIKIYDRHDKLIKSIVLEEVIESPETKKLLNKADFLADYNDTFLYKIN